MGAGLAGLALAAMLRRDGFAASGAGEAAPDGRPHFPPRARSVIWLFMNGGVSHLETFDPKPLLGRYAGMTIAETPFRRAQDPRRLGLARPVVLGDDNSRQRDRLYSLQVGFRKHGQSGIEISDWWPHLAGCVDDIAFVRSMYTTDDNHGAQTQFHSGRHTLDGEFPTLGAWVHYGLGSLNDNLPQFVSLGPREQWNARDGHYLGPAHDAVPLRVGSAAPLAYGRPPADVDLEEQRLGFDLVCQLNRLRRSAYPGDPALEARLRSYELAFRMQRSLPEALNVRDETEETHRLYGLDRPQTREFGTQLLASRRLVERGVRFIQIQHGAVGSGVWDAHEDVRGNHARNCLAVDRPIAGLLTDLKRRGLLQETLVLFATEFGRTPGTQGDGGRDHHIYGFSVWLAGGGIRGGVVHGATDEIGFHAVEYPHYVSDIHATILTQLGLDSRRLEVPGRRRLDMEHGQAIRQILS
jgi:hypothetical protein